MRRKRRNSCGLGLTVPEAKQLSYNQTLYNSCERNADGTPLRVRVSGQPKTWKRDPDRVEVPVKYGLSFSTRLTAADLTSYTLTEDEAYCCDGRPAAPPRPGAPWPVAGSPPTEATLKSVRQEMKRLQARQPHATGKGKECIEARLVALDALMERHGLTGARKRKRR